MEVLRGGVETTVQDYPGRLGSWDIGIPPSGPLDDYSLRLANVLVGNAPGEAALEVTAGMFSVKARSDLVLAVTGADMQPTLGVRPVPMWESFLAKEGDVLSLRIAGTTGFRAYIAVAGGIVVPSYLGSRSTFAAGGFGGFEGRVLKPSDLLKVGSSERTPSELVGRKARDGVIPRFAKTIEVQATVGPQAAPDFVSEDDLEAFFSEVHRVDRNANRLGYRLSPRQWRSARLDGGIAGEHPSHIFEKRYTVGSVNISGGHPILPMRAGPSAGGVSFLLCGGGRPLLEGGGGGPRRGEV